jgi:hypothetical protein
VRRAKTVERDAPDLLEKVKRDEIELDAAYKQARRRVRDQPKPEPAKPSAVMLTLHTHDWAPVVPEAHRTDLRPNRRLRSINLLSAY